MSPESSPENAKAVGATRRPSPFPVRQGRARCTLHLAQAARSCPRSAGGFGACLGGPSSGRDHSLTAARTRSTATITGAAPGRPAPAEAGCSAARLYGQDRHGQTPQDQDRVTPTGTSCPGQQDRPHVGGGGQCASSEGGEGGGCRRRARLRSAGRGPAARGDRSAGIPSARWFPRRRPPRAGVRPRPRGQAARTARARDRSGTLISGYMANAASKTRPGSNRRTIFGAASAPARHSAPDTPLITSAAMLRRVLVDVGAGPHGSGTRTMPRVSRRRCPGRSIARVRPRQPR
ncbi:hypothetical protein EES41_35945 [Streptomyces sp. ADI95-16]|nr:hypothetical protein EES41_35945 [Streptomyces sp. ADI95-16]